MLNCDCSADTQNGEPHDADCIHWDLPTDDPSEHYNF